MGLLVTALLSMVITISAFTTLAVTLKGCVQPKQTQGEGGQ